MWSVPTVRNIYGVRQASAATSAAGGRSRFGLSAEGANSAHYGSLATLNLEPRLLMPLSYVLLFVVCLCVAVVVCLLLLLRLATRK